jgi:hypothetical protein
MNGIIKIISAMKAKKMRKPGMCAILFRLSSHYIITTPRGDAAKEGKKIPRERGGEKRGLLAGMRHRYPSDGSIV